MINTRIIPVLLVDNSRLVKTTQFKSKNYIGDPINAIKVFSNKYVDIRHIPKWNSNDLLNKLIFLKNNKNIQTRIPVIIGVIRYRYDKS